MEVEVSTEIRAALGEILADVFGYVVGRCYRVTDGRQRAKSEGVHIIRPIQEATVYEPLGSRWSERGQYDVYLYQRPLEEACFNDYDFCKTGMVYGEDWTFPYIWDGAEAPELLPLVPVVPDPDFQPQTIEPCYDQLKLEDFL